MCPSETQGDPRYKEIGNQCIYYENKTLSQMQAQQNCRDKFREIGAYGKLFEPKTLDKNKAIAEAGQEIIGKWTFIGVDDIGNNETFKYSTGEHFISVQNPPWISNAHPKGTGTYCVAMWLGSSSSNAKWFDGNCESTRPSVCEATTSDQPILQDLKVIADHFLLQSNLAMRNNIELWFNVCNKEQF